MDIKEFIKDKNIFLFIAIPCYGGKIFSNFASSLLKLKDKLRDYNIKHEVHFLSNESLITRGRNSMVAAFMKDAKSTHLLFLDADIIFSEHTIIRLLLQDVELCGACYPKKKINWAKVKRHIDDKEKQGDAILPHITDMNFNPKLNKKIVNGKECYYLNENSGFIEVKDLPTGCMLINKSIFYSLQYKYPNQYYNNNVAGYGRGNVYNWFHVEIVDGIYLSEDYYFSRLVAKIGAKAWMDTMSVLGHTGTMDYYGSVRDYIKGDDLNEDFNICFKN